MNPTEGADNPAASGDHPMAVEAPVADAPAGPPGRVARRLALAVSALIVSLAVTASVVRVPYYRFSPGSLYPTESLVNVEGTAAYHGEEGQVDFTTVSSKKASVLDYLLAGFDEAVELEPAERYERGRTPEENRQENLEMMVGAKQNAEVAALRKLGYPVEIRGTGALVLGLQHDAEGRDLPAAGVLRVNDTIVEIDGRPIELGETASDAIGARRPGDTVTLKVESAPGVPARTEVVTLVSRCAEASPGECPPGDEEKPLLGVRLATRDTHFEMPLELSIDTKDVGGPSAGLAMTLGIIDVLTPGSLTGGSRVAATGTIDADGRVGPVGGIRQKTHLVMRQEVPLFLVPAGDEAAEASRYAEGSDTRVVPVGTLDDALAVLRDHGGRTDVVAEEAAMRSGTTAPAAAN